MEVQMRGETLLRGEPLIVQVWNSSAQGQNGQIPAIDGLMAIEERASVANRRKPSPTETLQG